MHDVTTFLKTGFLPSCRAYYQWKNFGKLYRSPLIVFHQQGNIHDTKETKRRENEKAAICDFVHSGSGRVLHKATNIYLGWRRGVVASVVRRMNEVTLRRVRLVLGWVTVFGRVYHHVM